MIIRKAVLVVAAVMVVMGTAAGPAAAGESVATHTVGDTVVGNGLVRVIVFTPGAAPVEYASVPIPVAVLIAKRTCPEVDMRATWRLAVLADNEGGKIFPCPRVRFGQDNPAVPPVSMRQMMMQLGMWRR